MTRAFSTACRARASGDACAASEAAMPATARSTPAPITTAPPACVPTSGTQAGLNNRPMRTSPSVGSPPPLVSVRGSCRAMFAGRGRAGQGQLRAHIAGALRCVRSDLRPCRAGSRGLAPLPDGLPPRACFGGDLVPLAADLVLGGSLASPDAFEL